MYTYYKIKMKLCTKETHWFVLVLMCLNPLSSGSPKRTCGATYNIAIHFQK